MAFDSELKKRWDIDTKLCTICYRKYWWGTVISVQVRLGNFYKTYCWDSRKSKIVWIKVLIVHHYFNWLFKWNSMKFLFKLRLEKALKKWLKRK